MLSRMNFIIGSEMITQLPTSKKKLVTEQLTKE
jgi:hypothetical protein